MPRTRTIALCHESAARQFAPYSAEAEDRAVTAWRALDRFTMLSADELRQQMGALIEMSDMIERALDAAWPEHGA